MAKLRGLLRGIFLGAFLLLAVPAAAMEAEDFPETECSTVFYAGTDPAEGEREFSFRYSDGWFFKEHVEEDRRIAKASLGASAAAYREETVRDLLFGQMGFEPVKISYEEATADENDIVGYAIGKKTAGNCSLFAVAVRGTPPSPEWFSNFNLGTDGRRHRGFYLAADRVLTELVPALEDSGRTNVVWVFGHSRGGAVANLIAGKLSTEKTYEGLIDRTRVFGYTFAAPPPGGTLNTGLKNIYNYCNDGDMVTQVPLARWGFRRYGQTIRIRLSERREVRKAFQELTGVPYAGYLSRPAAAGAMYRWLRRPARYEEKLPVRILGGRIPTLIPSGVSPKEILQAAAVFLMKREYTTAEQRREALKTLAEAAVSGNIPADVIRLYLGEYPAGCLLRGDLDGAVESLETSGLGSLYLAHGHCLELYWAWICMD